jgi:EAL domain-containing protein (putative c-di-GMP-specific phosphodiesterase class I)
MGGSVINVDGVGGDHMRRADREEFFRAIEAAGRNTGEARLAVLVDLGGLARGTRVSRVLGPDYADGIRLHSIERIGASVGHHVTLFLVENDCVAFLLPEDRQLQLRVERLVAQLHEPLVSQEVPAVVSAVAAAVQFRAGEAAPREVLRQAFIAALDARESGVSSKFVDFAALPARDRTRTILTSLAAALDLGQVSLAYQPRIDLATGACLGAEALLRWTHPELGAVSPLEFVPLFEQTGQAGQMTGWVAHQALSDLAAWQSDGFRHTVSINVSALNLQDPGFAERLTDAVFAARVDPRLFEVEFSEGALIRNNGHVQTNIDKLARIGVTIAIDDFGTGYSNLQYLRDIPARVLKIDQRFIRHLTENARDAAIVRSMIDLAHALGYRVVAEGIETEAALDMLASWNCDEGQGFFIARPAPLATMLEWLRARAGPGVGMA